MIVIILYFVLPSFLYLINRSCQRLPSPRRIAIVGDSITRSLRENYNLLDTPENIFDVFDFPGATVKSLLSKINQVVWPDPTDIVIVHVGTNTASSVSSTASILQQMQELIERIKCLSRCANVYVSLILPRWDNQELYERTECLNSCFIQNFQCVDCRKDFLSQELFKFDNLHLNDEGGKLFATLISEHVIKIVNGQCHKTVNSVPNWWIPPLVYTTTKKKKQADKKPEEDLEEKQGEPLVRPPAWATVRSRYKRHPVKTSDGFTQIGFISMHGGNADVQPALPVPCGYMRHFPSLPTCRKLTGLPSPPKPYVACRRQAKEKVRKKRREKKAKACRRERKVSKATKKKKPCFGGGGQTFQVGSVGRDIFFW